MSSRVPHFIATTAVFSLINVRAKFAERNTEKLDREQQISKLDKAILNGALFGGIVGLMFVI